MRAITIRELSCICSYDESPVTLSSAFRTYAITPLYSPHQKYTIQ